MTDPITFLRDKVGQLESSLITEIDSKIDSVRHTLHIKIVKECVIDGLSRLKTLDPNSADKYQSAINALEE